MLQTSNYDLYIFDCDGVILDANLIKIAAMEKAIIDADFSAEKALECSAYFSKNFGKSRFIHIRYFVEHLLDIKTAEQENTYESILKNFSDGCAKGYEIARVTPNFDRMLTSLKGSKAVASGSEQEELRALLKTRGYQNDFERIYGSPTEKSENVATILNEIPHTNAVMIGDAVADYEAAKNNSIDFIAYLPFSNVPDVLISLSKKYDFLVLHEW